MPFASRTDDIVPFFAMEVMERGMDMSRQGASIIQLCVGEPDFDAPPEAIKEAISSLQRGDTHYTDSRGIYALREAIARECKSRRGVDVDPDQIIVTSGVSPAILLCLQLLVENGDEVIIPTPHYPCYPNMVSACGGKSVYVSTYAENGFVIDTTDIKRAITDHTKAIIVASPANPTGAVQPPSVIQELASLGVPLLSDEIYDGLLFDDAKVTSPLGLTEDAYILDGFSKRYAMTGFRLGYMIAPKKSVRVLQSMQQSYFISASHFVQHAGIAALEHGQSHVDMMCAQYAKRRRLLVDGLRNLGLSVPRDPLGAFYVLADARHLGHDSLSVAFDLLEKTQVAVGPGKDFGQAAEGYVRFSYATSHGDIQEGLRRLAAHFG